MQTNKYIFFIGTGRTGTEYLASLFVKHAVDCYAVHEPNYLIKWLSNTYIAGKTPQWILVTFLRFYKFWIDLKLLFARKGTYIQSDPWLIGFVGLIQKIFPDAICIHIVRDPLTYIPSHLNRAYKTRFVGLLRDLIPYWKLRGFHTGAFTRKQWKAVSQEERMAWNWTFHNQYIESFQLNPERYQLFRYEDLFDGTGAGIQTLSTFCDISMKQDVDLKMQLKNRINTADFKFSPCDQWPEQAYKNVVETCQRFAHCYGYSLNRKNTGLN